MFIEEWQLREKPLLLETEENDKKAKSDNSVLFQKNIQNDSKCHHIQAGGGLIGKV
jgi:hypothetical protein